MVLGILTEDDVLGQVVDELSSQDVVGQLSVQLLLLFLLLLTLEELSIRSAGTKAQHQASCHCIEYKGCFQVYLKCPKIHLTNIF